MWEKVKNALIKNMIPIYYGVTALVIFLLIFVIPLTISTLVIFANKVASNPICGPASFFAIR